MSLVLKVRQKIIKHTYSHLFYEKIQFSLLLIHSLFNRNMMWLRIKTIGKTSLVTQWIRIHLPRQGIWGRPLIQNSTCHGAISLCTTHNYRVHKPQLLKPAHLRAYAPREATAMRKLAHCKEEQPAISTTRESPHKALKTQHRQK